MLFFDAQKQRKIMLMKYKDFKMLSIDDMKQIMGGIEPGFAESCGTCPSTSGGGVKLTCILKDGFCIKPANCNNAVECKKD